MGANFYCYFTPYKSDIDAALQVLREAEFKAGRYSAAMMAAEPPLYMFQMDFPPDASSPAPGPVHSSIEETFENMNEDGTGSILDIIRVSDEPDTCAACPLPDDDLRLSLGTTQASRAEVEQAFVRLETATRNPEILERIGRGEARYIIVYEAGRPNEIFFMGYTFD